MTKKQNVKVCYHKERTKKSRFRSKSALVLALFVANAVHTSGVIPVIRDGVVAYADVHYSYSPDDDCGVNQDVKGKSKKNNKDSSNSNKQSSDSIDDTVWTRKGTKAYQNAIDTINFWKEQGLSGVEIAGIIGNIGGAENTTFTLDLREEGGGSGGLYRFNPSSKYTSWSGFDGKWSAQNQGEFVLYSEPQSVLAYINKKNTSPSQSAEDWANLYERPDAGALAKSLQARKDASEKAYKVFELDKIEGDSKKVSTWGGSNVSQDKKVKISAEDGNKKGTKIDLKVAIKWFEEREGKTTYSQDAGSRKGPLQYDCSSAIYMALVAGGAGKTAGDYPVSTETEHEWLLQNGFNKVYEGKWGDKGDVKEVKKGDIIIWGTKGSSGGDLGHTMIMYDNETIIHSSAGHNGIARDTYSKYRDEATDHQTV